MSKFTLLITAVVLLLIANLGLIGMFLLNRNDRREIGMGHLGHPPHKEGGPAKIIAERLQFDEQQVAAFGEIIKMHQRTLTNLEDSIGIAKNALYLTLNDSTGQSVQAAEDLLAGLHLRVERLHYQHFKEIRGLCRKEQLPNFEALIGDLAVFFAPQRRQPPPPRP